MLHWSPGKITCKTLSLTLQIKMLGMENSFTTMDTQNGEDFFEEEYEAVDEVQEGFLPVYGEIKSSSSIGSFSGTVWLTNALLELDSDPNKWRPVDGLEDRYLNLKEITLGRRFASGASGRLYHGKYRGSDIALKILRPPKNEQDKKKLDSEFKHEVSLLSSVDHPNIVKLIGACHKGNAWCLATELLTGGNLKNFLRSRKETVSWSMVCDFASDIASAMEYLHKKNIIHRDLKSENMVFTGDGILKLTDFGISRWADNEGEMTAEIGTFRWMAPEVIDHLPYTEKIDVYSFGIVLWEIATGRRPFSDMTPMQVAFAVVSKNQRPPVPEDIVGCLGELMEQCWDSNPNKRPSFIEILEVLRQAKKDLIACPESLASYQFLKREKSERSEHMRKLEGLSQTSEAPTSRVGCCVVM